ncbi:MAG: alpha-glucan family phosphorylase [Anaerolineaceae bacterium]
MRLRASRTLHVEPVLPPALESLRALTRNLYWTWNTDAVTLFERIDRDAWEETGHNPVRLLQHVPVAAIEALSTDDGFLLHLERVTASFDAYMARPRGSDVSGMSADDTIAYFSLEFALTESLPNYSGGLGVLAGDHLKSASDLRLPLVAVSLLYHQGYFQQALGPDGWQAEEYRTIDLRGQPLTRVRDDSGEPIVIAVPVQDRNVFAAIWRLDVGQVPLFLLDTHLEQNQVADREISGRLYGGDVELRIQQEMLLGIGGVRALQAMGVHPSVCHMNEGHSALLGVERIRMVMQASGASFEEARLPVSAATAFTTHTAVAAGIDLFPADLMRSYLRSYYEGMGIDERSFLGLGRSNPDDEAEPFSMALLGLRLSGYRNGVSKLHRTVSRKLWESAWPQLPEEQIPIDSVTNGVHLPTWVSHEIGDLYDRYLGREWRDDPTRPGLWTEVNTIPDEALWQTHERQRERLIYRARDQSRDAAVRSGTAWSSAAFGQALDPKVLTIGFARRFAGYKRATLLFRDPERLARIVNDPQRPVQFIFSGKAHPRDEPAKQLIREVLQHSRTPEFRDRLVLLERYDVELARSLVQGCDVWINTPLRPLEASGTSGMKATANGALHLSVLDGWWWEAYRPGLGWAIGRDRVDDDPEVQDAFDSASLYDHLENEVTGSFYTRDADGIPRDWVRRMKLSIEELSPVFNTSRMVTEYARKAYAPAAASWRILRENNLAAARDQAEWLRRVTAAWGGVEITRLEDSATDTVLSGTPINVTARINSGGLAPTDLRVDILYGTANPDGELGPEHEAPMTLAHKADDDRHYVFEGSFAPEHGGNVGYAVRVLPSHANLHSPFVTGLAHWA